MKKVRIIAVHRTLGPYIGEGLFMANVKWEDGLSMDLPTYERRMDDKGNVQQDVPNELRGLFLAKHVQMIAVSIPEPEQETEVASPPIITDIEVRYVIYSPKLGVYLAPGVWSGHHTPTQKPQFAPTFAEGTDISDYRTTVPDAELRMVVPTRSGNHATPKDCNDAGLPVW